MLFWTSGEGLVFACYRNGGDVKTVSRIEIIPVKPKNTEPEKRDPSATEACDIGKCCADAC
ncbi:hypothetical protein [Bartonella sp. TT121SHDZB]|uniref:hypothetical protein n=1 Tax=Bartonella sp. TT121SHDZB TaxID=3243580 RepID=UPI0035CFA460